MKTCVQCGRTIREDAGFCYACGAPNTSSKEDPEYMAWRAMQREESYRRQKERRRKRIHSTVRWMIFILFLLALVVYSLLAPSVRTLRAAMGGDEAAVRSTSQNIGNYPFEETVFSFLTPLCADYIVSSYNKGTISAADAGDELCLLLEAGADGNRIKARMNQLETLTASKKAWRAAEKAESSGDYATAMVKYASVAESDAHYREASEAASRMAQEYKNTILGSIGTPTTAEEYRKSIVVLTKAVKLLPDEQELSEQLTTVRQEYAALMRTQVIEKAKEYEKKGYYYQVIVMINKALKNNPDDEELQKILVTVTNAYDDFVKSQVQIYEDNRDWKGAMALLERVRKELPDDAVIDQLYQTTKSSESLYGITG